MIREQKLIILKRHLKRITKEFCEIWGTCNFQLAEEIDEVMTEIQEIEKSIELEKEIVDSIKQITNSKEEGES